MRLPLRLLFALLLAFSNSVLSDESTENRLVSNLEEMESLMLNMTAEKDEWQIRASMQRHALLMLESVELSGKLFAPNTPEQNSVNEQERADGPVRTVGVKYDSNELKIRWLTTLMRHVVLRQNIMMERFGLFK